MTEQSSENMSRLKKWSTSPNQNQELQDTLNLPRAIDLFQKKEGQSSANLAKNRDSLKSFVFIETDTQQNQRVDTSEEDVENEVLPFSNHHLANNDNNNHTHEELEREVAIIDQSQNNIDDLKQDDYNLDYATFQKHKNRLDIRIESHDQLFLKELQEMNINSIEQQYSGRSASRYSPNKFCFGQPFQQRPSYQNVIDQIDTELYNNNVYELSQKLKNQERFQIAVNELIVTKRNCSKPNAYNRDFHWRCVDPKYRIKQKEVEVEDTKKSDYIQLLKVNMHKSKSNEKQQLRINAKQYVNLINSTSKVRDTRGDQASDLSSDSEKDSNLSHEFAISKSRQLVCLPFIRNIEKHVIEQQRQNDYQENFEIKEDFTELAEHYVGRMVKHMKRILDGEDLGPLVESEFENVSIDYEFEKHRQMLEGVIDDESSEDEVQLKEMTTVEEYRRQLLKLEQRPQNQSNLSKENSQVFKINNMVKNKLSSKKKQNRQIAGKFKSQTIQASRMKCTKEIVKRPPPPPLEFEAIEGLEIVPLPVKSEVSSLYHELTKCATTANVKYDCTKIFLDISPPTELQFHSDKISLSQDSRHLFSQTQRGGSFAGKYEQTQSTIQTQIGLVENNIIHTGRRIVQTLKSSPIIPLSGQNSTSKYQITHEFVSTYPREKEEEEEEEKYSLQNEIFPLNSDEITNKDLTSELNLLTKSPVAQPENALGKVIQNTQMQSKIREDLERKTSEVYIKHFNNLKTSVNSKFRPYSVNNIRKSSKKATPKNQPREQTPDLMAKFIDDLRRYNNWEYYFEYLKKNPETMMKWMPPTPREKERQLQASFAEAQRKGEMMFKLPRIQQNLDPYTLKLDQIFGKFNQKETQRPTTALIYKKFRPNSTMAGRNFIRPISSAQMMARDSFIQNVQADYLMEQTPYARGQLRSVNRFNHLRTRSSMGLSQNHYKNLCQNEASNPDINFSNLSFEKKAIEVSQDYKQIRTEMDDSQLCLSKQEDSQLILASNYSNRTPNEKKQPSSKKEEFRFDQVVANALNEKKVMIKSQVLQRINQKANQKQNNNVSLNSLQNQNFEDLQRIMNLSMSRLNPSYKKPSKVNNFIVQPNKPLIKKKTSRKMQESISSPSKKLVRHEKRLEKLQLLRSNLKDQKEENNNLQHHGKGLIDIQAVNPQFRKQSTEIQDSPSHYSRKKANKHRNALQFQNIIDVQIEREPTSPARSSPSPFSKSKNRKRSYQNMQVMRLNNLISPISMIDKFKLESMESPHSSLKGNSPKKSRTILKVKSSSSKVRGSNSKSPKRKQLPHIASNLSIFNYTLKSSQIPKYVQFPQSELSLSVRSSDKLQSKHTEIKVEELSETQTVSKRNVPVVDLQKLPLISSKIQSSRTIEWIPSKRIVTKDTQAKVLKHLIQEKKSENQPSVQFKEEELEVPKMVSIANSKGSSNREQFLKLEEEEPQHKSSSYSHTFSSPKKYRAKRQKSNKKSQQFDMVQFQNELQAQKENMMEALVKQQANMIHNAINEVLRQNSNQPANHYQHQMSGISNQSQSYNPCEHIDQEVLDMILLDEPPPRPQSLAKPKAVIKLLTDIHHDWTNTNLYRTAEMLQRFKKPDLRDEREKQVIGYISQMRVNPYGFARAHVLMPIFEMVISFLEDLLINEMGLDSLFTKIKSHYKQIDYNHTLKLLARTRICSQIRNDIFVIICEYLDVMELQKNIGQLRDENASDELILNFLENIQIKGAKFLIKVQNFITDYKNTFKRQTVIFGGRCVMQQVQQIMEEYGSLISNYKQLND